MYFRVNFKSGLFSTNTLVHIINCSYTCRWNKYTAIICQDVGATEVVCVFGSKKWSLITLVKSKPPCLLKGLCHAILAPF